MGSLGAASVAAVEATADEAVGVDADAMVPTVLFIGVLIPFEAQFITISFEVVQDQAGSPIIKCRGL